MWAKNNPMSKSSSSTKGVGSSARGGSSSDGVVKRSHFGRSLEDAQHAGVASSPMLDDSGLSYFEYH